MNRLTDIIAARIPGPFRPYGPGAPHYYESAQAKAGHLVAQYRARRARGLGASEALAAVLALPPVYRKGGLYRSPWARPSSPLGAPFKEPGRGYMAETLRWTESTESLGLRFIGWSDELPGGPSHRGWFTRDDESLGETLRGGVWQWPGGRVVYGFAEMEGGGRSGPKEMNPGSAALVVSDILQADAQDLREEDSPANWAVVRDAAAWADSMAESQAEERRDWDSAYHAGRLAAESIQEAEEDRQEARDLLAEMRQERQGGRDRPAICKALRSRVESILGAIKAAREARESAWRDCPGHLESAWRDGYAETLGNRAWNAWARTLHLARFNGEAGAGLLPVS